MIDRRLPGSSRSKGTTCMDDRSRRQEQPRENRVPPGQYVTTDFPVLSMGPTPQIKRLATFPA